MTLPAAISLDLDNEWSYLKTHGNDAWQDYPSYLDVLVPYVLDLLDDVGLRITFFIVGQDAALEKNRATLQQITARGHDVGNHSFSHEPWLHLYSPEQVARELDDTSRAIGEATGQRPLGFRGPGFSISRTVLEALADRGYLYDASTLPTYLGPLARFYYFRTARLSQAERAERKELFGTLSTGLLPAKPYFWHLTDGRRFLELPVTTIPGIKTPFHLSYLLYLARHSNVAMRAYLECAIAACRATRTPVSFLLHPLDFLGREQVSHDLSFFPGMDVSSARKAEVFRDVLARLARSFEFRSLKALAAWCEDRPGLPSRTP